MKKVYVKPTISFESFKMSSSIAGNCDLDANMANENSCGYDIGGGAVIFTTLESGCLFVSSDGTEFGVCYDVPIGSPKVFAS